MTSARVRWSVTVKWMAGLVFVALAVWCFSSYRISEFYGDGHIRDSGVWTYPRYHVEFSEIPLFENGEHRFRLAGLPSEEMSLELLVVGKTEKDRAERTRLKTDIAASLKDDKGRDVCKAGGIPSDGQQGDAWIRASSDDRAALYNRACVDVQVHRKRSYILELTLTQVDHSSPRAFLVPVFSGGGNELP
jgi:hypothetical protein